MRKPITHQNLDFIPLNAFLKKIGICQTGGQAKIIIRSGKVKVNGVIETRNQKKLVHGDKVEFDGKIYPVAV